MQHLTRKPTKYEQERIDALRPLGCVACAVLGVPNLNHLELHHILDGGIRMGHWFTIFLCRGHHQGDWSPVQIDCMKPKHRVAISDGRKRFNAVYKSERALWERCQEKLKLSLAWPLSKVLPRRLYVADLQNLADHPTDSADSLPANTGGMGTGDRAGSAVGGEPS